MSYITLAKTEIPEVIQLHRNTVHSCETFRSYVSQVCCCFRYFAVVDTLKGESSIQTCFPIKFQIKVSDLKLSIRPGKWVNLI